MKPQIALDDYYNAEITLSAKCPDCDGDMVVDTRDGNGAWDENRKLVVVVLICTQCGSTGSVSVLFDAPNFGAYDDIPF